MNYDGVGQANNRKRRTQQQLTPAHLIWAFLVICGYQVQSLSTILLVVPINSQVLPPFTRVSQPGIFFVADPESMVSPRKPPSVFLRTRNLTQERVPCCGTMEMSCTDKAHSALDCAYI